MSDELPQTWCLTTLADLLVALESGSRPRGGVRGIASGVPSIGGEHVKYDGGFAFQSVKYVPKDFARGMSKGWIRPNDILVVKDGATTGKTAFVGSDFPYPKAVVNEHVFICRPSEEIEPRFLFRYLTSKEGQDRILQNFKGSAQGGINQTFAPNTEVPLAPLPEQRRIVVKLEKLLARVDASQKRLDRIPQILKRFRESVLAAACSGGLTGDWREDNKANVIRNDSTAPAEHIEDLQVKVPEGWTRFDLISLCDNRGITYGVIKLGQHIERGVPCLRTSNVRWLDIDVRGIKKISRPLSLEYGRTILKGREVLVNVRGTLGGVAVVPDSMKGWNISREVAMVPIRRDVNADFAAYWIASGQSQNWLSSVEKGAAYTGINLEDLRLLPVALPEPEEQQEIVHRVQGMFALADQIEARYAKAKAHVDKLTQSILARAFRGELVPQDPNDEPATVLLERIRAEHKQRQSLKQQEKGNAKMIKKPPRIDQTERHTLVETLLHAKKRLKPEDLFVQAGYDDHSVEQFFIELRVAVKAGKIKEIRPNKRDVFLQANQS